MTNVKPGFSEKLKDLANHDFSKFIGTSSLMFAGRVVGAALVFVTQLLLARWMGAYELGIYVYAFSWLIILATVMSLGFEQAAFRVIGRALADKKYGEIRGFIRSGRVIAIITGMITVMVGIYLSQYSSLIEEDYRAPLMFAFLGVPVLLLIGFNESISHAYSWFILTLLPNTVFRPLITLMLIIAAWYLTGTLNAERVMIYQLIALLLALIGHYLFLRQSIRSNLPREAPVFKTRAWLRLGFPQLLPLLFISFIAEINVIMVGLFLPAEEVAIFSVSFRVAMLISFMIYGVDSVFRPQAARLFAEGNMHGLQTLLSRSTQAMFWPALCCVLIFLANGEWILALFGEEFTVGYLVFTLLTLSQLILVTIGPVATLLNVTGHQDLSFMVLSCALFALLALNAILIPLYGMTGAAVSVILITAFWNLWMRYLVVKHLNVRPTVFSYLHAFK